MRLGSVLWMLAMILLLLTLSSCSRGSVEASLVGKTASGRSSCVDRHRGGGRPPTPATPPCVRVRTRRFDWLRQHSSNNDGSPSDLKYALESPTDRALARARYQGPRPLPAVLRASGSRTPSSSSAARRRRGVFHCRHKAALSRNRTQRVKPINTSGVSQNPK